MKDISIVIVCMNNLNNLYPCLDSIKKYTKKVNYETLVVAYLFSPQNLNKVKNDYPWVTLIESNELRGFSENNNLALSKAKGKYCFVLNDDTEMKMPVIDLLFEDIEKLPYNVACVSPKTLFGDGRFQSCGRPPLNWKTYLLSILNLWKESNDTKWIKKEGLFRSYNLVGAAFLIRTDIFKKIGWFDEYYFFCPEDIKVGTDLNKLGYECWVDSNIILYHYEGGSSRTNCNKIQIATTPASTKGSIHYFSGGNIYIRILLSFVSISVNIVKLVICFIRGILKKQPNNEIYKAKAMFNTLKYSYGNRTPKNIFTDIFTKL